MNQTRIKDKLVEEIKVEIMAFGKNLDVPIVRIPQMIGLCLSSGI